MFSRKQFHDMYKSAQSLGLGARDKQRWLWSYYASRLPNAASHRNRCVKIEVRLADGQKRPVMIRTNGFDWMVVEEIFQRKVYRVALDNVHRILDVGGNIGLATVYFAGNYPGAQICVVEPIAENLAILRQNLQLNGLSVTVIPAAAGTEDGKAVFQVSEDPRQHTSTTSQNTVPVGRGMVEVDVLSIPSLMDRMGWSEVDLLKMDIEGSEKQVLAGKPSWLKRVRGLICEGHVGVGYSIDCARRDLEPMGFQLQVLDQTPGSVVFFAQRHDAIHPAS